MYSLCTFDFHLLNTLRSPFKTKNSVRAWSHLFEGTTKSISKSTSIYIAQHHVIWIYTINQVDN